MKIYRGQLKLLDYLFYATVERGKVYETGAFVHNYALSYALHLATAVPYSHLKQTPHYAEELSPLNGKVYLTPATPQRFSHRLVQWNTIREGYGFSGKGKSIGYPDWGFARMLRPDSAFVFYVLVMNDKTLPHSPAFQDLLAGRTTRIRLGKFDGKAHVTLETAVNIQKKEGSFTTHTLLNWRDCPTDPIVCDVLPATLPTRLINHTHFPDDVYYQATFDDKSKICLPADMAYLARPLPTERGRRKR